MTDATGSEGGIGESQPDQEHRVVVGVDASAESQEALRWAARYARLIGSSLDVVHAWHLAEEHAWLQSLPPPAAQTDVARKALAETVATVLYPGSPLAVRTDVVEGHAVKVLTHAAEGADLLVLGDRGFGGFDGLRLGSVSEQCAAHASCSVVIVRSNQS